MTKVVNNAKQNPSNADTRLTNGTIYFTGGFPNIVSGWPLISMNAVTNPLK
jgi:hypothetical protein